MKMGAVPKTQFSDVEKLKYLEENTHLFLERHSISTYHEWSNRKLAEFLRTYSLVCVQPYYVLLNLELNLDYLLNCHNLSYYLENLLFDCQCYFCPQHDYIVYNLYKILYKKTFSTKRNEKLVSLNTLRRNTKVLLCLFWYLI